ncbi:MAG: hypothetical protein PVG71_00630 [Anaerolineae bacterium]|jgi:hypothetical protein
MPAHRKASIRELSKAAYELESGVLEGRLHRDPGSGVWMVGEKRLDAWLDRYHNHEIVLIVASLDDERPMPVKTCRTCGMEYRGLECPRCRQARIRLRGR